LKCLQVTHRFAGKPAYVFLAILFIWVKTYLVQRFCFSIAVKGWYQEVLVMINPLSSILIAFCIGMFFLRRCLPLFILSTAAISSFILLADLVYYRFFNDFLTIPVLFQSENMGDLRGSILSLLRPLDMLIFTDAFALSAIMLFKRPSCRPWNRLTILAAATAAAGLFAVNLSMAHTIRPELLTRTFDRQIVVKSIGAYNYHLYDALINARMGSRKAFASTGDLQKVKSFLSSVPADAPDERLFGAASGFNVFLVSMESLQSFVIGRRIDGNELTPFLNRLIHESYYFDNFYHQTGQGKTSDAEFLVETSLYPLPSGAVYFTHAQNVYETLPQILRAHGYYTAAFHANDPSFWNRGNMYRTMGYERFYSVREYSSTEENSIGWGLSDEAFFEQSVELIKQLPRPFYAKMITLTNHYPFELNEENQFIPKYHSRSGTLNRYVTTVRYMDEALKTFFAAVKAAGLYERSIFVLYGDHYGISPKHKKSMAQLLGKDKLTPFDQALLQRVPLIIHIPGMAGGKKHTVSGQVDVKPTLLHLLGVDTEGGINFGHDIFSVNRHEFAVFRDGSFVTDKYVFTENTCFDKATGLKTDPAMCGPMKEMAVNHLTYSDSIIYGDLLRFIAGRGDDAW
jgi:lipoteichoic acid synthase